LLIFQLKNNENLVTESFYKHFNKIYSDCEN